MNKGRKLLILLFISSALSSCEFKCQVGDKMDKEESKSTSVSENKPVLREGAQVYNGIQLKSNNLELTRAYLAFDNNDRVPEDNFVDFTSGVRVVLSIRSGWKVTDGSVSLGAAEKIEDENGNVILNEEDLFANVPSISAKDAETIALKATIKLRTTKPTYFTVYFRVWDKNGDASVEGSYKLYSK